MPSFPITSLWTPEALFGLGRAAQSPKPPLPPPPPPSIETWMFPVWFWALLGILGASCRLSL